MQTNKDRIDFRFKNIIYKINRVFEDSPTSKVAVTPEVEQRVEKYLIEKIEDNLIHNPVIVFKAIYKGKLLNLNGDTSWRTRDSLIRALINEFKLHLLSINTRCNLRYISEIEYGTSLDYNGGYYDVPICKNSYTRKELKEHVQKLIDRKVIEIITVEE